MDASPDALAERIREKRAAIDRDLDLLKEQLKRADPRRVDWERWARTSLPFAIGTVALWLAARRRRPIRSLEHLLAAGLSELYEAEQQLAPALERMHRQTSNPELQQALRRQLQETEGHIDRLQRVFRSLNRKPGRSVASAGVPAILADGERLLRTVRTPDLIDAGMAATLQRVGHVKIAAYRTLQSYADRLARAHAAQLLQQTLLEEQAADETLTRLAALLPVLAAPAPAP